MIGPFSLMTRIQHVAMMRNRWLLSLLTKLQVSLSDILIIWFDNQGTTALAANLVYHARCKDIEIDLHFVCDQILQHNILAQIVPPIDRIANVLTKPLPKDRFQYLKTC
uniref:Uncharacterized protein n=1 Tax=Cannabis sativa TaxID=3483 RepID=A0A803Q8A5_CANSA